MVIEYLLHEVQREQKFKLHLELQTFKKPTILTSVYAWHMDSYKFWC